ncbi:MAG: hypothetical protein RLZZ224_1981 [Verrucomicrobiota bacterium]|jgi:hypothetical protein
MNQDEPIIKLTPTEDDRDLAHPPVRLDAITKKHQLHQARHTTKPPVALRVIEEPTEPPPAETNTTPATSTPRPRAYEGKSQDYTIDEIMQAVQHDPDAIENEWSQQAKKLPNGLIAVICFFLLLAATAILLLIQRNHRVEDQQKTVKKTTVTNAETEVRTAQQLVQTIQKTIEQFFLADTIDEKLAFVRYPDEVRPLMEAYYAKNPIRALPCDLITSYEFFTQEDRCFWKILTVHGDQQREWVNLEQISDTEVRIDWESLVHYQPMPWSDYTKNTPYSPQDFRVTLHPTPHYVGEFADESRWASYRITAEGYDEVLFGYVMRNSEAHAKIEMALSQQSPILLVTLMIPPNTTVKHTAVIQKVISSSSIRLDAPKIQSP